jgi:hypothetical protein
MRKPVTSRTGQRGQALIEFAIGFFVLWLVFAGVYQFGYSFWVYNQLLTSVSNAAQLGSKMQFDLANRSGATTSLQNMVLYGSTSAGARPMVSGLTASNVTVRFLPEPTNSIPSPVPEFVSIEITNYTIDAIFRTFTFSG